MQSTGQALAHLSQPIHVVRSNLWKPRYRAFTGTGFSGYSKCCVNAFRLYVWKKYQRVTYIPSATVLTARTTLLSHGHLRIQPPGDATSVRLGGDEFSIRPGSSATSRRAVRR